MKIAFSLAFLTTIGVGVFLALPESPHAPVANPAPVAGPTPEKASPPKMDVLPLLEEDLARLAVSLDDSAMFEARAKVLHREALALAAYAQVGMRDADKTRTRKIAQIRNTALNFAEATKGKRPEEAKRVLAVHGTEDQPPTPRSAHLPLNRIIPQTLLMESVGNLNVILSDYGDLPSDRWTDPRQNAEIAGNAWRFHSLMEALISHVPIDDPNPRKGQTRRLWEETTRECRTQTELILSAAMEKRQGEFKATLSRLESVCNRCHDVYRVE